MLFTFVFPALQTIAFFLAIGADCTNLPLAIVNDETMTTKCPNFTVNHTAIPFGWSNCTLSEISCRFLTYLEHPMIDKIRYDSLPQALDDIRHGKVVGALYMADNFSSSLEARLTTGKDIEPEIVGFSEVKVWLDMSSKSLSSPSSRFNWPQLLRLCA